MAAQASKYWILGVGRLAGTEKMKENPTMSHLFEGPILRRVMFAVIALALIAASCSGSADTSVEVADDGAAASSAAAQSDSAADESDEASSENADDGAGSDAESGDESADDDEESDDSLPEVTEGESPLAEFMGWGGFGDDFDEDDYIEQERQIERSVQECMQKQGFEYNPRDVSDDNFFGGGMWPGEDLSEEEYAAQYGFGMSTTFDDSFFGGFESDEMDEYVDPNGELMEAMSDGERDAWQLALYGKQPDFDEETGMPIDPETGEPSEDYFYGGPSGCFGEAQEAIYGSFDSMMALDDEFQELYDRIEADPRIAEISEKWASCMAEAGFTFTSTQDMYDSMSTDFNELQNEIFSSFGPGPGFDEAEMETMTDAELEALFAPPSLTEEQEARLAVIQEEEIKLAVANQACDQGADEIYMTVSAEYELQFIEDNRALLEGARGGN